MEHARNAIGVTQWSLDEHGPLVASIQDAVRTMCLYQAIYDAYLAGRQGRLDLPEP